MTMPMPSKIGSQKILVVDDDLDTLKLVGTTLEKQGFIIVAAKDGLEALEKVAQHMPDLILLDIMMPKMDGYEVTRRLRTDPATSAIPIVLFTAKAQVDDKVAGLEAGADDYLTKPTHPAELVARVRSILKRPVTSLLPPLPESREEGAVVGVLAAKGGQGVTMLAINLGATFQRLYQSASVIIAELRPGRGDMGLILGSQDEGGLIGLLKRSPAEIHRQVVEGALANHRLGFKMLLSSIVPTDLGFIGAGEQAASIVRELARMATYCVLDLGVGLPPTSQKALQQCTDVILVVEPDPHTMRQTKALIDGMTSIGVKKDRILTALVSRVRSDLALSAVDVQKSLGLELNAVFTPAPELAYQTARTHVPMVEIEPQGYTAQQTLKLVNLMKPPKDS